MRRGTFVKSPCFQEKKPSELPVCRAFVVMNFHSESVDFVMDFCVKYFCEFLGAFRPFKRRTENPQRNPQQNSRRNPCKIHACSEKRRRKIHSAGRGARKTLSSKKKHPVFANRLTNRPFFGLVCLGGFQSSTIGPTTGHPETNYHS